MQDGGEVPFVSEFVPSGQVVLDQIRPVPDHPDVIAP